MREPAPFQLLMKLDRKLIEAAFAEVELLARWGANSSRSLNDPRRRSAVLRGNNRYPKTGICGVDLIDTCFDTPNIGRAPTIMQIVNHVRGKTGWNTKLGLVTVSVLGPGGSILPHVDGGEYFNYYHRVQIPLSAGSGITFSCEDVTIEMQPGEVWCLDNKRVHWVNNSSDIHDRVNLFFDTR